MNVNVQCTHMCITCWEDILCTFVSQLSNEVAQFYWLLFVYYDVAAINWSPFVNYDIKRKKKLKR